MTSTRRNRPPDRPHYSDMEGSIWPGDTVSAADFAREVLRRDRRDRDAEVGKIAKGLVDPDDVPTTPKPRRRWQFWRRS